MLNNLRVKSIQPFLRYATTLVLISLFTSSASASTLTFQEISLAEDSFVSSPNHSVDNSVTVTGESWGQLKIARPDEVDSFINPSSDPRVIDWKQISVSADGQRVIAASSRSEAGGYIYLSTDSGTSFQRLDALGNANWTSAIFGTNPNELLVLDGGATVWSKAANGSNCLPEPDECFGSGLDGSNLESVYNGATWIYEQPFALAYYSPDSGANWSNRIVAPSGDEMVEFSITSVANRFLLKKREIDWDGDLSPFNTYYELMGRQGSQEESDLKSRNLQESYERALRISNGKRQLENLARTGANLGLENLAAAGIDGISTKTINLLNKEIAELSTLGLLSSEALKGLTDKWASTERIMSGNQITSRDLITAGAITPDTPFQASILRALKGAPVDQKDSLEKIQQLIVGVLKENQSRRDRLAKRLFQKVK